jgi:acetoin utilization deacetylase AcuC-like enzyme
MSSSLPLQQRARLIFETEELSYDFGPQHPLNPKRLQAMVDLLESAQLWHADNEQTRLDLRSATNEELGLVHTSDYLAAVQRLSKLKDARDEGNELVQLALHYGFGDGDTPVLLGMHEATARIAGGTLVALSAVMGLPEGGTFAREGERPLHVFHPAGGLHHAWPERASGFCIYNDAAVAIAHILRSTEAKVLYIDFDAHRTSPRHLWIVQVIFLPSLVAGRLRVRIDKPLHCCVTWLFLRHCVTLFQHCVNARLCQIFLIYCT